ncbi:MAG: hypothetical protein AABW90_02015 [Nanoarchaeota archaeon]
MNKMQKNINEKSRGDLTLLNLEISKLNKKMKIYLLLISILIILSVGLVFGQPCSGPSCGSSTGSEGSTTVYWDQTQQKLTFEQIDPTTGQPRPEATGTNLIQDKQFMETNWDTAKESQKIEYIKKTYPNLKLNNNPANFKLKTDGSLDFNGKEVFSQEKIGFLNENNAEITFGGNKLSSKIGRGTLTWTPIEKLKYQIPQNRLNPSQFPKTGPGNPASAHARAFGGGGQPGQAGQGGSELQQLLQILGSIAQQFAQQMRSNGQGQTTATQNSQGGTKATLAREAALALEDGKGNPKLLVSQNNKEKDAEVNTKGKNNEMNIKNANIIVPEQLAAKVSDETTLKLNGIDGDDPDNPPKRHSGTTASLFGKRTTPISTQAYLSLLLKKFQLKLPLYLTKIIKIPEEPSSMTEYFISFKSENKITGKQISSLGGQSIELNEHDLELNGHDIESYALKTFNNLEAGGQDLVFFSGDFETKFHNQQILISRTLPDVPYGVKKISNKLDRNPENSYVLQHYENANGEFKNSNDKIQRVSFSDITIEHPTNLKLIIWEEREEMWQGS